MGEAKLTEMVWTLMRMNACDFSKRVYESTIEGRGARERPPVKWINRVEEYWRERAGRRGMECAESA